MPAHVGLQHADCHEPRHITISTIADAGKVITPSSSASGSSELRFLTVEEIEGALAAISNNIAYGAKVVQRNATVINRVAAVDTTYATASDYTQIAGIFLPTSPPSKDVTLNTDSITLARSGVYEIGFWADVYSSVNNNVVSLALGLAGVAQPARNVAVRTELLDQPYLASANGIYSLPAGTELTLHFATKVTSDVRIGTGTFSVKMLEAL